MTSEVITGKERAKSLFGRRDFFAVMVAGAAVVTPRTVSLSAALADAEDGYRKSRHKETEHIRTFYKVNRL